MKCCTLHGEAVLVVHELASCPFCPNLLASAGELKLLEAEPSIPKRKETFQALMDGILRDYMKLTPGNPDPREKGAVSAAYRRFGRAVRDILALAKDDPIAARRGIDAIGDRMESKGLSWNLDTVAKWFPDWATNPEGFENETRNGTTRR